MAHVEHISLNFKGQQMFPLEAVFSSLPSRNLFETVTFVGYLLRSILPVGNLGTFDDLLL